MNIFSRILIAQLIFALAFSPFVPVANATKNDNSIGGYCIKTTKNGKPAVDIEAINAKIDKDVATTAPKLQKSGNIPERKQVMDDRDAFKLRFQSFCQEGIDAADGVEKMAATTTGNAFSQQDGIQSAAVAATQATSSRLKETTDGIEKYLTNVDVNKIFPDDTKGVKGEFFSLYGQSSTPPAKRSGLFWKYLRLLQAEQKRFEKLNATLQGNAKKVTQRKTSMESIDNPPAAGARGGARGGRGAGAPDPQPGVVTGSEVPQGSPPKQEPGVPPPASTPVPEPTPTPAPENTNTLSTTTTQTGTGGNFFSENKNALLVGGAVLAAGGVGLWAYNKNKKKDKSEPGYVDPNPTSTSTSTSTSSSTSSSTSTSTSTSTGITGKAKSLRVTGYPPQRAIVDQTINPVTVQLMTADGQPDTSSGVTITVSCTKSCALVGVTSKTTDNGAVSFTDLRFSAVHSGTQLIFNSPGMNASASTGSFRVEAE